MLAPGDDRQVFIGQINDSNGSKLVDETGLVDVQITTPGCCDLRTMEMEPADLVKVKIRWNVPDGWYVVTMGSTSNCGTRGDLAHVTRMISSPDTTWVITSGATVGVCRVIDKPGKKNDTQEWLSLKGDAVVDLNLTFSTSN